MSNKYQKTKYPNITTYETKSGTRYRIRKKIRFKGDSTIVDESGFKNLAHAKSRLREIEQNIDKSEIGYIRSQKLTVDEYYIEYAKQKSHSGLWSADTRYSNDSLFKNHINPVFGNIPLIQLDRTSYELFINQKLEKLRRESVRSIHIMFMALINDAVYNGVIERNRLMRVPIGKSKVPAKNKRVSLKDYQLWIETAKKILTKYEFSIIYLCIYGLRRGEVCALRESVISYTDHPDLATIHIVDSRTMRTVEFGKGSPKTSTSERYVVLDKPGTEALQYVIQEAKNIRMDYNEILHKDDFLLLNPTTNVPYHPTQLNRWFERVSEACDIKISPHMLRHFFATQAAIAGVPKEHVAKYLGHNNKTMTEHYTHIQNETAAGVIDIVSKRLEINENHA
jgi:Site-specific recombinase XerD